MKPVQRLGGGGGCNKFVPVLGGDGSKITPTRDIFDQPPGGMISIRGKLADQPPGGRVCFGDLPGDGIVVSPPSPIVERLMKWAC